MMIIVLIYLVQLSDFRNIMMIIVLMCLAQLSDFRNKVENDVYF